MDTNGTELRWPQLRVEDWAPTRHALHMWTQIVGKIRLALAPPVNHWWHVTLYVSPRGLTTSTIHHDTMAFDIEFDFIDHDLRIRTSDGDSRTVALGPMSVADFHDQVVTGLDELRIKAEFSQRPDEVDPAIPFSENREHIDYDAEAAHLFWRQLLAADQVMGQFRSGFVGKVSPVHFFWGAMDLACTRFSGRPAPPHPGGIPNLADWVSVEGYSHELFSCGFWPGGGEEGAFYAYAYPEPEGFDHHPVVPAEAHYSAQQKQFLLPYEAVRRAAEPNRVLSTFFHSTYEAAATLASWDRAALETDLNRTKSRG